MNAQWLAARSVRLSLATRVAVLRARNRRQQGRVLAGWPRLTLRWRRPRPRRTCAAAGRRAIATHNYWFPAYHLHLTGHATQPVSKTRASDAWRLTDADGANPGFRHVDTTATSRNPPEPHASRGRRRAAHVFRARQIRLLPPRSSAPGGPRNVNRSPISATTASLRIHRRSGPSYRHEPAPAHRRVAGSEEAVVHRHLRTRKYGSRESQLSTPQPSGTPLPGALTWRQSPATHRPAELAWRRLPQSPTAAVDRAAGPAGPVSARPLPAAVASTPDGSHVDTRKDRPAVLPAASVDSRLLDRLTDDVIRRVERRIRIERERRGL